MAGHVMATQRSELAIEHPRLRPRSRAAWRSWLERYHDRRRGVWLVFRKKPATAGALTLEDAVEEALCFGWIDSRLRPVDAGHSSLLFTPRRKGSIWSGPNKRRVGALINAA